MCTPLCSLHVCHCSCHGWRHGSCWYWWTDQTNWVLPVSPETECQVTLRITLETSRWTWMVLLCQLFSISCCILLCESLVSSKGGNFLIFGSGAELWDIPAAVTSSLQPATFYIPSFGLIGAQTSLADVLLRWIFFWDLPIPQRPPSGSLGPICIWTGLVNMQPIWPSSTRPPSK